MRTFIASLALALIAGGLPLAAQQEKSAVLTVVKKVFDGMRTRDTTLMRAQFAPGAQLVGVDAKSGTPALKTMDPSSWLGAVAKATGPAWDERIFDPVVEQDDNIAHVWAYYEFWRGPTLSHCGYDSFFLVKLGDGWKVTQVADTRRTECKAR
jgi:hypothetical protein